MSKKIRKKKAGKRPGIRGRSVRLSQAEVSAIWRATSAGDLDGATFIAGDLKKELSAVEARRVAIRVGRGANSHGVSIGYDPVIGEYADVLIDG